MSPAEIISALRAERATVTTALGNTWEYRHPNHRAAADLIESLTAERDALKAEVEWLRTDAENYRWLRDKSPGSWRLEVADLPLFKGDLNAAIDAARGGDGK